jgi:tetratricopeptide (TPR) repeat protein
MVEGSRPARVDSAPIANSIPTQKRLVPVKRAMDEALKLYNAGKFDSAERLCAQIVEGRPRMAPAHNLMGAILSALGKHKEAAKFFQRASRLDPKNAQYLSNLGEIERQRGKLPEALAALTEATSINPKLAQANNNLGIVYFERRDFTRAIECYERALATGKAYPEAHNNMGNALRGLGRLEEALDCYQKALLLRENYPEAYNNLASVLRDTDQIAEAEHCYRKAVALKPTYLEAYNNLASLLTENSREDEALRVLGDVLRINAKHVPALVQIARTQLKLGNLTQAEQAARIALKEDKESAEAHAVLGQVLHETDRFEEAVRCYRRAVDLKPDLIEALNHLGVCLKSMGRLEESSSSFRKVIELNERAFGAYSNLADIEKFTETHPLLQKMEKFLSDADDPVAPRFMSLHYALGKAYEDIGQHERAFEHFKKGAILKRARLDYKEDEMLASFDMIRNTFTKAYFEKRPFAGNPSDVPVFIVGMARSGSTLIEQVISSHLETFGAGEIKEFSRQIGALRGRFPALPKYPQMVAKMNAAHYQILADAYLAKIRSLAPHAKRITDKLLTNANFVGLIHVLFPNAKIIHTRRNPIDTCLSAFTKLFKDDMPYSYDLGELGRYCRKHNEMMDHWREVIPPSALKVVNYEEVVEDLPKIAHEVVEFLGLAWNDACLNFHESSRPVKTASVIQVRKPVYASSVERWRRHEKELQPLLEALAIEVG